MPALVIIDMQSSFRAHDNAVSGVLKQIRLFKKYHYPIVLVEYQNEAKTIDAIEKKLSNYNNVMRVEKDNDDGSEEVSYILKRCHGKIKNLTICGVNTCHCVSDTSVGLVHKGFNVKVIYGSVACTCNVENKDTECLEHLRNEIKRSVDERFYRLSAGGHDKERLEQC